MNLKNIILGSAFAVASVGIMINQSFGELEQIEITSEGSLRTVMVNPYGRCAVRVQLKMTADALVGLLDALPLIEELVLVYPPCEIGVEGGKKIAEWLGTNSTLIKLDLSWNELQDEGAIALAEALRKNKTLKN